MEKSAPIYLGLSLLLLNIVASLLSAGAYVMGTLTAYGFLEGQYLFFPALLVTVIVCALCCWLASRAGRDAATGLPQWVPVICCAVGSLLFAVPLLCGVASGPVLLTAGILAGIGVFLQGLLWALLYHPLSYRDKSLFAAGSFLIATALSLVVFTASNSLVFLLAIALSPIASGVIVWRGSSVSAANAADDARADQPSHAIKDTLAMHAPVVGGSCVGIIALGLMWGVSRAADEMPLSNVITMSTFWGYGLAVAGIVVVARLVPSTVRMEGGVRIASPFALVLPMLTCIFPIAIDAVTGTIVGIVSGIGFAFFSVFFWVEVSDAVDVRDASATTVWGLFCSLLCLCLGLGIACANVLAHAATTSLVLALFVAYLIVFASRGFRKPSEVPEGGASAPSSGQTPGDIIEGRCEELTRAYRLSPRERDVLAYLARGHSTTRVAEELCISSETVKAHVKHIYEKMGVHSREELLDLFGDLTC